MLVKIVEQRTMEPGGSQALQMGKTHKSFLPRPAR